MKKILGVIVGVGLSGFVAHAAFAQLPGSSLGGAVEVTEKTVTGTTETPQTSTTPVAPDESTPISPVSTPVLAPTPTPILSPVIYPLSASVSLGESSSTISGVKNIFIKTNRKVVSAELRLMQGGTQERYLGRANFDVTSGRWVFAWNSTPTPDGSHHLFAVVKAADGVPVRSSAVNVAVKNEKREETRSGAATTEAPMPPRLFPEERREKYLKEKEEEKLKKEEERRREEEKIKKELSNKTEAAAAQKQVVQPTSSERTQMRGIPVPPKPTPIDFEKIINEKSQELNDAVESGDTEKRKEIIADIVRTAHGIPAGTPIPKDSEEFAKKVEESVLKLEQVILERERGIIDEKTFKVERVHVAEVATRPDGTQTASKIAFRGKALPDSFVTLYIFSIPIVVTVKTDADGNWDYTLDKELEDGSHQVYVGITDVKGKVVVRSNPVPFVKTASAITVEEALATPVAQAAPSFVENNYFYGIVTIIIMIVAFIFVFLGIKMSKTSENPTE